MNDTTRPTEGLSADALLAQALRIPTMPFPDPAAHSLDAYARAVHAAYCALRFKIMDARAVLAAANASREVGALTEAIDAYRDAVREAADGEDAELNEAAAEARAHLESVATRPAPAADAREFKAAFDEWHAKTEWVQQEVQAGKLPVKYLGWHRADVMRAEIERLRAAADAVPQAMPAEISGFKVVADPTMAPGEMKFVQPSATTQQTVETPAADEREIERLREIARDAAECATNLQREVLQLRAALARPAPEASAVDALASVLEDCDKRGGLAAVGYHEAARCALARTTGAVPAGMQVTDAMVTAYLAANDAYWKRADALPTKLGTWRQGTPSEATRVSLEAALAAAKVQETPEGAARGESDA